MGTTVSKVPPHLESKQNGITQAIRADNVTYISETLNSVSSEDARTLLSYRFDRTGNTLLHQACKLRSLNCAKFFLDHGLNPSELNADCQTSLHIAVLGRHGPLVQAIIQKGVNTRSLTRENKTALDLAQDNNFVDIVRLMENLLGFFTGYLEKRSSSAVMSLLNQYSSRWVVIMDKNNGDSYPEGGRLIIYDNNTSATPKKVYPLYGAKLYFEEGEPLCVTVTTLFADAKLKLRAPDQLTFKNLITVLTGQHPAQQRRTLSEIPQAIPLASPPPVPPRRPSSGPAPTPTAPSAPVQPTVRMTAPIIVPHHTELSPEELVKEVKRFGGECSICMDAPQNSILVPCGHNGACYDCGLTLFENKQPCPVCRAPIAQVVRFYPVGV